MSTKKRIAKIYFDYLDMKGTDAADYPETRDACMEKAMKVVDIDEAVESVCYAAWRTIESEDTGHDKDIGEFAQFCIAEIPAKKVYRYRSDLFESGWATVLANHATIGQAALSVEAKTKSHQSAGEKIKLEGVFVTEALNRANNDLLALIRDYADEEVVKKAG